MHSFACVCIITGTLAQSLLNDAFQQLLQPKVQEKPHCCPSGPGSKEAQSLRRIWSIRMQLVRIRQSNK